MTEEPPIRSYRGLKVWQRAMDVVLDAYHLAQTLPAEERFELGSQLRRAAVSVPANIAEGHGREGRREYLHFLSIASGSLAELQTLLLVIRGLSYHRTDAELQLFWRRTTELSRMLSALRRSLKRRR